MRALILGVASLLGTGSLLAQTQERQVPKTVDEAATRLVRESVDARALDWILRNPRETVVTDLYSDFGRGLRNEFGLWKGNRDLLASCGTDDPEGCSVAILRALWQKVRQSADPDEVKALDCQFRVADSVKIRYKGFRAMRIGEVIDELRRQIDAQLPAIAESLPAGCASQLTLKVIGDPDLRCWVRAEQSENGRPPKDMKGGRGRSGWRNAITLRHRPPELELVFQERCTWPKTPTWFNSGN